MWTSEPATPAGPLLRRARAPLLVFLSLLAWEVVALWPVLSQDSALLLAANPDGIITAWILAIFGSGDTLGPLTRHIIPGAVFVPEGFLSALSATPLVVLLGPVLGMSATVAVLLALGGTALAWACREATGSWAAGGVVAAPFLAQPVVLQTVRDGNLQQLTFWVLFGAMAALLRALREGSARWAAVGIGLGFLLPLEFPYGVAFGVLVLPAALILPAWSAWRVHGMRRLGAMAVRGGLVALPVALVVVAVFLAADLDVVSGRARDAAARNSIDLGAWASFLRQGGWTAAHVPFIAPFVDLTTLIVAILLALVALPRSLPLLVAGVLALGLSLGASASSVGFLGQHGGPLGAAAGTAAAWLSDGLLDIFPFSFVRFPRRWALVGGASVMMAGAHGIAFIERWLHRWTRRIPRGRGVWPVCAPWAGIGGAFVLTWAYHAWDGVPDMRLPKVEACAWIQSRPGRGGVLLLPTRRPPPDRAARAFAGLDEILAGADRLWLQVLHGRPQPPGDGTIPTIWPLREVHPQTWQWVNAADALSFEFIDGVRAPLHATRPWRNEAELADARLQVVEDGFRWIMADARAYEGPARVSLDELVGPHAAAGARLFPDGEGIIVYELTVDAP